MDRETKKADAEYAELRSLCVQKEIQRGKELSEKGILIGLDGPNYYQDIDDWFNEKVSEIKKKYGIISFTRGGKQDRIKHIIITERRAKE